jgi:hypothetical protein
MMSFANPTALYWAALAIPIVLLYVLKIRLRRVPVSTIIFWRQIFEEKQPRSIWERLRHIISLLIQLFLLSLLVLALAAPYFNWEILEARRFVMVVDNSASMNATDEMPTRLDAAKRAGMNLINSLRFRDEMAIVSAGSQPQLFCGLTGHQRTLRRALESIPSRDGPSRTMEAVELARRLVAGPKHHKVVVLSDGAFDDATQLAHADDVDWIHVGKKTGNVGITQFQVRRSLLDSIGYEILIEVVNYSEDSAECRLELDLDGTVIDVVPIKLAAEGRWTHVFEKTSADGGILTAKIDRSDTFDRDNFARALLPRRSLLPVLLVTEGDLFLQKVFEANPIVQLTVQREPPDVVPVGTVLVLHQKVPPQVPAGSVLVVDPAQSSDLWELGGMLDHPLVAKQDKESPVMAHVKLDNVLMPEARKLTPVGKAHELVTSLNDEPLYLGFERPSGKVLVLTVNLDRGDLPLRTAFPIMVTNALAWFGGAKGELRESVATGAISEADLARDRGASGPRDESNEAGFLLRSPNGDARLLPAGAPKAVLGPFDQCGVWAVEPNTPMADQPGATATRSVSQPILEIAVNLANRRESDLRVPANFEPRFATAAAGLGGRPLWFYLVALAWCLAALEWFLYNRRWIS